MINFDGDRDGDGHGDGTCKRAFIHKHHCVVLEPPGVESTIVEVFGTSVARNT